MSSSRLNPGSGPSQRQLRVGELIRRALSEILARDEVHDPDLNRLSITVGEVVTSPDLRTATVHILPLGGERRVEALAAMKRNKGELKRLIGRMLDLRHTPDLRFQLDETFDRLDDARRLFADERVRRDIEPRDETEA